jgi:hypothetical protein
MVTNVFFATTILFMAAGFFLLDQCLFLIPYKSLLVERYGSTILLFGAVLFINIYAALYFGCASSYSKKPDASWLMWRSSSAPARAFPRN